MPAHKSNPIHKWLIVMINIRSSLTELITIPGHDSTVVCLCECTASLRAKMSITTLWYLDKYMLRTFCRLLRPFSSILCQHLVPLVSFMAHDRLISSFKFIDAMYGHMLRRLAESVNVTSLQSIDLKVIKRFSKDSTLVDSQLLSLTIARDPQKHKDYRYWVVDADYFCDYVRWWIVWDYWSFSRT